MKNIDRELTLATHYVGLGPGKAGTTFVYDYLRQHPCVYRGAIKEIYYFAENYSRGREWYRRQFSWPAGAEEGAAMAYGDIGNQYFKSHEVIERALTFDSATRFILFYRDPVDRLISCYKFEKKMGSKVSLSDYIKTLNPEDFNFKLLEAEVSRRVPADQLLVLDFHALTSDPERLLSGLCDFLRIPFFPAASFVPSNVSVRPRSTLVAALARKGASILREHRLLRTLQRLKSSRLISGLLFTDDRVILSKESEIMVRDFLTSNGVVVDRNWRTK